MYVDGIYSGGLLEFRRLTEQVRVVDNIIRNKFRKPPAEKLYRLTAVASPDPATQALRDELQASRLPFQVRQWRPLTPEPEPTVVRCRPLSRPTTAHGSYSSASLAAPTISGPQRPRSTPVHGVRTPHISNQMQGFSPRPPSTPRPGTPRVDPGRFDTLSPRIMSKLLEDVHPRPFSASYGDRIMTRQEKRQVDRDMKESAKLFNDDLSTTSGIDSDGDDSDGDDNNDGVDEDDGDSSDSEQGGFEPSLDDIRRQMPHPQSVFRLRPEKLDAIYVPEDKRDMRRFDFDAEKVDLPPYLFKNPLPDSVAKVSLRLCAREGSDWRDYVKAAPLPEAPLKAMMDRLVELERYQIVTEDWEARKLRGQARRQEKSEKNGTSSGRSGSSRLRDRRCCGLCLQAACVGDCPEKRLPTASRCEKCHQPLCTGACQDSSYEERMRRVRSSDNLDLEDKPPPPPPPRSPSRGCHSCLRRHNGKVLNANNLVLGRPKSSYATYSRGKSSQRQKDLRPASAANMHGSLVKDFERMGIDPHQPAPPSKPPISRPRSRNGLLPGKSSRSNRKFSITDSASSKKKKTRNGRSSKAS
ncbi:uncharacterized protein [Littorina saxatilis]|uniref:Uncharacterized protein n=1 Tax=Littorina saxatilis TaxID=31220 RepID=A0AAN9C081_9CAEN